MSDARGGDEAALYPSSYSAYCSGDGLWRITEKGKLNVIKEYCMGLRNSLVATLYGADRLQSTPGLETSRERVVYNERFAVFQIITLL